MSAHNRTWNLFPGKVNQQYPHTKVNQHVLAEEVPKNTNKNQIPSLRNQLSNHVQSVASPQYKHQWKCAMRRRSSLISAFLWNYIQPRSSTICCLKRHPNQDQSIYLCMIPIHFVSTESKPQTHGIFYCWGPRPHKGKTLEICESNCWQIVSINFRKLTKSMKGWKGITHEIKIKFGWSMTHDPDPETPVRLQKFLFIYLFILFIYLQLYTMFNVRQHHQELYIWKGFLGTPE